MVEIIRKGQLPSEKKYEAECSKCKTLFRFKEGETNFGDQRDGGERYIQCPVCQHYVWQPSFRPVT